MAELARFLLVHDGDPSRVIGSRVLRVNVLLNPADVALDDWAKVFDPRSLRIFVHSDRARLEMFDVLPQHRSLILVRRVLQRLSQVRVDLLEVLRKLAKLHVESLALELSRERAFAADTCDCDFVRVCTLFEDSCVHDIQLVVGLREELFDHCQVVFRYRPRKVGSDATLIWKVQLRER